MRMREKNVLLYFTVLLLTSVSVMAQQVLSPTEGTWANYQSIVLNLPSNVEAYYSLTGENPLDSGFAYDGPVLVKLDGDVNVNVVFVDENDIKTTYSINYTVNLQDDLDYAFLPEDEAVIVIDNANEVEIPQNVQYALGNNTVFSNGTLLSVSGDMIFERKLLLTINDGDIPYRYVLQLGDNSSNTGTTNTENDIEIYDWNYVKFLHEGPTIYSIDNEPLRQTNSGEIFIDRTKDRVLRWQKLDGEFSDNFASITLPKQPEIIGLPKYNIVNNGVTLSLSDSRYMFGIESNSSLATSSVFYIDTVVGDAFGFSSEIDIYYDNIKHGSTNLAFIIDKISPSKPILMASDTSGYSRENVTVNVQAADEVYYYIPTPKTSKDGFLSDEYLQNNDNDYKDIAKYKALQKTDIHLINDSGVAQVFDIYAFSKDNAGNVSETVHYKTVIDPYNFYLVQDDGTLNSLLLGTKDHPLTDISQLNSLSASTNRQNVYIDGVFQSLTTINIHNDVSLILSDASRLIFRTGESIVIQDATVSISGGSIEQSNPDSLDSLQNTLLNVTNATLTVDNIEFILSGGVNSNCIVLENSSIQFVNSGVTVQSEAYGVGIKANNSVVLSTGSRFVLVSETAIGMSLLNSSTQVSSSTFTATGTFSRSLEFINSNFSVINNKFTFERTNGSGHTNSYAIRLDSKSVQNGLENNKIDGFSSLVLQ